MNEQLIAKLNGYSKLKPLAQDGAAEEIVRQIIAGNIHLDDFCGLTGMKYSAIRIIFLALTSPLKAWQDFIQQPDVNKKLAVTLTDVFCRHLAIIVAADSPDIWNMVLRVVGTSKVFVPESAILAHQTIKAFPEPSGGSEQRKYLEFLHLIERFLPQSLPSEPILSEYERRWKYSINLFTRILAKEKVPDGDIYTALEVILKSKHGFYDYDSCPSHATQAAENLCHALLCMTKMASKKYRDDILYDDEVLDLVAHHLGVFLFRYQITSELARKLGAEIRSALFPTSGLLRAELAFVLEILFSKYSNH